MPELTMTRESELLFEELAEDAPNWGGEPLINGNVEVGPARKGNLTHLKKMGLITTFTDEGCSYVQFTKRGKGYAKNFFGLEV